MDTENPVPDEPTSPIYCSSDDLAKRQDRLKSRKLRFKELGILMVVLGVGTYFYLTNDVDPNNDDLVNKGDQQQDDHDVDKSDRDDNKDDDDDDDDDGQKNNVAKSISITR